jgi:hypothetical protein
MTSNHGEQSVSDNLDRTIPIRDKTAANYSADEAARPQPLSAANG